jgi:hypothetical protein
MEAMGERLLTALGAIAATVAVIAAAALLFHVLDDGGDDAPARTTVIRVAGGRADRNEAVSGGKVAGPQRSGGDAARPGHAAVGAKVPRRGGSTSGSGSGTTKGESGRAAAVAGPAPAPRPPTLLGRPVRGPAFEIAHVRKGARVDLESEPGGPIVARLADKTEFGSPASFSVVATKPGWLGVTAPEMPNGDLAWIARDPRKVDVYWTRWSIHADLGGRTLELRYGRKPVGRFAITIGGPGTESPPGRYGVTDGISFRDSPYYGCCALALSGHQTRNLPAGWIGGNRLAIHGTPGAVGNAESLGCIRATDETMRFLFRRVPLGTPVFVEG